MENPIKRKNIVPKNVTVHLFFEIVKIVQKNSELFLQIMGNFVMFPAIENSVVKQYPRKTLVKR